MRHLRLLVALMVFAGVIGIRLSAQTSAGSMSGSVVDESGQVVPGADVTITNEQTGEVRRGVSNGVGDYTFPLLQPGPYTVRAELSGFKPYEIKNNMVLANDQETFGGSYSTTVPTKNSAAIEPGRSICSFQEPRQTRRSQLVARTGFRTLRRGQC